MKWLAIRKTFAHSPVLKSAGSGALIAVAVLIGSVEAGLTISNCGDYEFR